MRNYSNSMKYTKLDKYNFKNQYCQNRNFIRVTLEVTITEEHLLETQKDGRGIPDPNSVFIRSCL